MKRMLVCLGLLCIVLLTSCQNGNGGSWYDFSLGEYLEVGEYKNVAYVPAVKESVTEEGVDAAIEEVLREHSSKEDLSTGNYALGDEIKMDFEGVFEGEVCRSSQGYTTAIGAEGFFGDFEGGLTSLVDTPIAGEHKLSLTFLPDHADPRWAGKTLEFTLKIQRVTRYHTAQLNDEFVKELGLGLNTVEEYRTKIRSDLEERAAKAAHAADVDAVWEAVLQGCRVKQYPSQELESYVEYFTSLYEDGARQAGMNTDDFMMLYYGLTQEEVIEDAKSVVKQDLLLYSLCEKEHIGFTQEEYLAYALALCEEKGVESVSKLEESYSRRYVEKSLLLQKTKEQLLDWAVDASAAVPSSAA